MKKIILLFTVQIAIVATAAPIRHWSEVPVPRADAFKGWRNMPGYVTSQVAFMSLPRIKACNDKPLIPTGPTQMTKLYHEYKYGEYELTKVFGDADDRVCLIATRNTQKQCLRADMIHTVVISDLYKDDCGKTLRAFWRQTFLKQDESMGALQSFGRSLVKVPKSQFPKDYMPGPTHSVGQDAFMFLTEVFKE